ncbi:MAG: hypothetical protein WKG06_08505 [Segetibacter sp.]
MVLKILGSNKTRKFKLTNYFESCAGRLNVKYDWSRNGEIPKVNGINKQGQPIEYFAIAFTWEKVGNERFPKIKEEIKKISTSKWIEAENHWGVPLRLENELLEFAKPIKFF